MLRNLVKSYIDNNRPVNYFVEPFAGGAGLSLWLLFNKYVNKVYINDLDRLIFMIWDAILNNSSEFIKLINDCPITIDEWFRKKALIDEEDEYSKHPPIEIAFAAFFLNRCNRSGIITRVAGPIGGKNQNGIWKIDARFNKPVLIQKIHDIAKYRDRIILSNHDAITFLDTLSVPPDETFYYLDPPYYSIGKELYRNYYTDNDHVKLRDFILSRTYHKWLISYDNNQFIKDIYADQSIQEISLNHQAHIQHSGNELIITPLSDLNNTLVK